MSYVFDIGRETVWSPANTTGRVYTGLLTLANEAFELDPGANVISSDYYEFEPNAFTAFVNRLLEIYENDDPAPLVTMLHGFLKISIVMATRAGLSLSPTGERGRAIIDHAGRLGHTMPDL
ncbi:DUF6086 family protein [Saccharomonospora sp. CUA-673]|uniref:DUF6086 family protein n=1 Tax=Saccharomonospora sp. CUA-673 TaxID=1904969 RepID=UPI001115187E|nr:DUF6086 family protein [Saccharomonospora sp. CUA-673]